MVVAQPKVSPTLCLPSLPSGNVGTGKAVKTVGIGGKGNSGVAAGIKQLEGAIGYLNYGYVTIPTCTSKQGR